MQSHLRMIHKSLKELAEQINIETPNSRASEGYRSVSRVDQKNRSQLG